VPVFVDTNILVYAEDRDAGLKHETARSLVQELWQSREGILSIQILQEFFVTVTRKVRVPLSPVKARRIVEEYMSWQVVENTGPLLLDGIRLAKSARLSLWDALVVAAARSTGCDILYTEDLNEGQRIDHVRIVNPFG